MANICPTRIVITWSCCSMGFMVVLGTGIVSASEIFVTLGAGSVAGRVTAHAGKKNIKMNRKSMVLLIAQILVS
jgi:hypothetical protein